jgi:aminoglycoside N3'-acetyltransferase
MKRALVASAIVLCAAVLVSAQSAPASIHGTVKEIDIGAKSMVVGTEHGTDITVHFAEKTVFHGTVAGGRDAFQGLKEGTVVVAHTAMVGTKKIALEVDVLGKGGLKSTEGTISRMDAAGKEIIVKTADGSEHVFEMTEHVTVDASKATARQARKAGKATVYYTEEGGKKIAHFFTQR